MHNQPVNAFRPDGLSVEPVVIESTAAKFDLSVHAAVEAGEVQFGFGYNPDIFDPLTIESLAGFFTATLTAVSADANLRLDRLGMQPAIAEAHDRSGHPVDAFVAQVRRAPQAIAVSTPNRSTTYAELNEQANGIAQTLRDPIDGARPPAAEDSCVPRIGVLCRYDETLVATLLGISKAGGAWVPIDPLWPAARCAAIAADAGLTAICTDRAHAEQARAAFGARMPLVELDALPRHGAGEPDVIVSADALAYLIYTSGTTGIPKAVAQTQRGLLIQAGRYSDSLAIDAQDRLAGLSGYAYDAAIQDIFGALLTGATICPVAVRELTGHLRPLTDISAELEAERISVLHLTPSLFRYLVNPEVSADWRAVRAVVLGGEAVYREDFAAFVRHFSPGTKLVNGLGLTEATMALQFHADHETRIIGPSVPVGTAVPGLTVQLLDEYGEPGWSGEIVLRGRGLSPGDWREYRQSLSAGSGRQSEESERVLHTGDLGFRLPDGRIVHTGRLDNRTKIRGFRVEAGEVEAALSGLPVIADCAVSVVTSAAAHSLAAYLVAEASPALDADDVRKELAALLPEFMLPESMTFVAAIPRLANGKVDWSALPAPGTVRQTEPLAPRNPRESALLMIWQALLPAEMIGMHDNFFTVGGHSLLATRVVARVRDELGIELPLSALFDSPTIAGLADAIEQLQKTAAAVPRLVRIPRDRHRQP